LLFPVLTICLFDDRVGAKFFKQLNRKESLMHYRFHRLAFCALALFLTISYDSRCQGAGVTVVTHGLNSNVDSWVSAMTAAIPVNPSLPGTNYTTYNLSFVLDTNINAYIPKWSRIAGAHPLTTDSGEILINLDWRQWAGGSKSVYEISWVVAYVLAQTNFISELNGHAVAELPIHLIGHSRGGSLVSEMCLDFGTNGIWVDHFTPLDPHPLNNDGFDSNPPYTVVDAPVRTYENVLFADNYWQTAAFHGESVAGAYNRQLIHLEAGYWPDYYGDHFDVHLWYHGTIDLRTPTSDSNATLDTFERSYWYESAEQRGTNAGFCYSLIAGGDRLSTNKPAGSNTDMIRTGYNQHWDLGAGSTNNRTALPTYSGRWPNPIKVALLGSSVIQYGQSNSVGFYYQWARPSSESALAEIFIDTDHNPFNGNERLLGQMQVPGTGQTQVNYRIVPFTVSSAESAPGTRYLFVKMTDGSRRRYSYVPQALSVQSGGPPQLVITRAGSSTVAIDVYGTVGQRIVLEVSTDLSVWQPRATNVLSSSVWRYTETVSTAKRFFRVSVP